ncbi:MAG: preprotein translocase subunit YajC [Planctomycetes bacterium]|nr:preprotein translocase subunit YajC [Planctomycetota bacterium]
MFNSMIFLAQDAAPSGSSALISMLLPFALLFGLMYLLLIRPQNKKEKMRQEMINSLQKNDHVITSGGMFGIVSNIKDDEISLKVDEDSNVKIRVSKNAIVGVIKRANP